MSACGCSNTALKPRGGVADAHKILVTGQVEVITSFYNVRSRVFV
jgi:hypothetical protein